MSLIKFVCFVVFVSIDTSLSFDSSLENDWLKFKETFSKKYSSDSEEKIHKSHFEENVKLIASHNRDYDLKLTTFTLGLNEFSDMNHNENRLTMSGLKIPNQLSDHQIYRVYRRVLNLPQSFDWREKGVVTPIKYQGKCSSCWAFSATGSMEAAHAIKTGKLVSLSEQNLIDCSSKQGNNGCNGGWPEKAFNYVITNGGINTEQSYPYTAKNGTCNFDANNIGTKIFKYLYIKSGDEKALQQAVVFLGPVSVAIHSNSTNFQNYKSGIFDDPSSCINTTLNHALLVVGYGSENGRDYWIVKNSWGTSWGMDGYGFMSRNNDNQCGIATRPVVIQSNR